MSLLRQFLDYTSDPEVVAEFQKSCGIIHCPKPTSSKEDYFRNGEVSQQNGISPFMNGKIRVNGVHLHSENNGTSETNNSIHAKSESDVKHRNGVVKNHLFEKNSPRKQVNGVIRTGTVPFRIENKLLYYLFCFGAQLGNAIFYVAFYSLSFWNFDAYVSRRIVLVWCACMYFGQTAKDFIRVPRPKSPPVVRLETRYELEYGMPSTHACVGTAIPLCLVIFSSGRFEFSLAVGLGIAAAWCILVCLSRIYLGMHNILDVLAGVIFAIIIMTLTVPFVDSVHEFLMKHPLSPVVCLLVPVILTLLHPTQETWNTCRGDTMQVLAITAGIFVGTWLNYNQGFMTKLDTTFPITVVFSTTMLLHGALRLVFGVTIMISTLLGMKSIVYKTVCRILNKDPKDIKSRQSLSVELPYKYIPYFLCAFNTLYLAPLAFHYMGIQRAGFYTEF